jgi:hypothetical protein
MMTESVAVACVKNLVLRATGTLRIRTIPTASEMIQT